MLFYAGLTVASVLVAVVIIWVIKSVTEAGRSVYRTISPGARSRSRTRLAHLNENLAGTPSPWGWSSTKSNGRPTNARSFSDGNSHQHARVERNLNADRGISSEKLRRSRIDRMLDGVDDSPELRSARNVLSGYDLTKKNPVTDTSCWPYRDNFENSTFDRTSDSKEEPTEIDQDPPTKPWGW